MGSNPILFIEMLKKFDCPLEKKILFNFVAGTFINIMYYLYYKNFDCFFLRQFLIVLTFVLVLIFKEEYQDWASESLFIDKTLIDKFPVLKLEPFFILTFSISAGLIYSDLPAIKPFSYTLAMICYFGFIFWGVKAYCIYKTPIIYTKYINGKAGKMGGLRFLTFISSKFAPLASGVKYAAVAGTMVIAGEFVSTKTIDGFDRRSSVQNVISKHTRGLVSKSETLYSGATTLLDNWPDKVKRADIVKEDGITVDGKKVLPKLVMYAGSDYVESVTKKNFEKWYPRKK